jgi:hypothetical protein
METLYFLLPILVTVALISFTINRINTRSYLNRRIEARQSCATKSNPDQDLSPRAKLEKRYVDWFTREDYSQARRQTDSRGDDDFLMNTGYMASGMSYRPEMANRSLAG